MNSFLSRLHIDLRRALLTRRGATQTPKDVPTGVHKSYPRMEQIALPEPLALNVALDTALAQRRSSIACPLDTPLSLQDLGTLLGAALRKRNESERRNYPSGGGLYPIETYVIAETIDGAKPGVFHYEPTKHRLERLWNMPEGMSVHDLIAGGPETLHYSALIVFTSIWDRSSAKYGDFAYMLALLEAGHMSENILLVSSAMGLETRPMLGFNDQELQKLLDIDEYSEQPVLAITVCKPQKKNTDADEAQPHQE